MDGSATLTMLTSSRPMNPASWVTASARQRLGYGSPLAGSEPELIPPSWALNQRRESATGADVATSIELRIRPEESNDQGGTGPSSSTGPAESTCSGSSGEIARS
jgi:hypothetical protein